MKSDKILQIAQEATEAIDAVNNKLETIKQIEAHLKTYKKNFGEISQKEKEIRKNSKGIRKVLLWFRSVGKRVKLTSDYIQKTESLVVELKEESEILIKEIKDVVEIIKEIKE